jgi:hypothetical protein
MNATSTARQAAVLVIATLASVLAVWTVAFIDVPAGFGWHVEAADGAANHIVRLLMMLFLFQTIIIPLLLAWALFRIAGALLQLDRRLIQ